MALQARTEFAAALNQIASEKGVDVAVVVDAIQQAALAAYRKDLSLRGEEIPEDFEEYTAKIDPATGGITIHHGDHDITPPGFARIAAQTAKQVITQRLHEAEKGAILDEFNQKVGSIVSGTIQRQESNTYFIDLGRAEGVLPPSEQTRGEVYLQNQRMKFLIKEIREDSRGPSVILSRADAGLIIGLFALEVPEIQSGAVEIKAIAREAGGRTKVAAISTQEGVDPVGSLVGQKGVRVQAVINEIGEEKVDIVPFSEDPARFIASALSPAKEVVVTLDEENKTAKVKIPESSLSLAIGKGGQNVRLAAKLTGWKIDIEGTEAPRQADQESSGNGKQQTQEIEVGPAEVVKQVEKEIDQATEEESLDGAIEPDPLPQEAASAAADAMADISTDSQMQSTTAELASTAETSDTQRGDLLGDKGPSAEELVPVDTTETPGVKEEMQSEDQASTKSE